MGDLTVVTTNAHHDVSNNEGSDKEDVSDKEASEGEEEFEDINDDEGSEDELMLSDHSSND